MTTKQQIHISLANAPSSTEQHYLEMDVPMGTTILQALQLSGWLEKFTELAEWCEQVQDIEKPTARQWHVGIYSQKQPLSYQLQDNDRIEIYRILTTDPMHRRKKRAKW